tara:strand:- start:725 stop:1519 length:795 start_codon:yes stop_codon:yes gene_type:complete
MMKKYLVIGNPIEHSLSPKLHNFWLKKYKVNAVYEKKKINENELTNIISEIKKEKINGINVTVPFKKAIIPLLEKLSPEAEKTQSVNTIFLKNNSVVGHNTDIDGFEFAIKELNIDIKNKKIFILGAGGVVPSLIFAFNRMMASKIIISNRTKQNAENLKKLFNNITIVSWGELPEFDVIINATSIGLNKNDKINLDFSKVGKNKLFYDVIYNSKETNFLKIGKQLGNKSENGKLMFIYQAVLAFKLWHGINPDVNKEIIELLD